MTIKNLHPMVAAQLKTILKRDDINIDLKREPGVDTYTVFDSMGKELFYYSNGWDYGLYSIVVNGVSAASIEWRENDNKTTSEQKAVFEIGELIGKKMEEQRLMKNISAEDKKMLDFLQGCATKGK